MATEEPSTQTIAVVLIIVCLVVLLPCLYMRVRMNRRNAQTPVFGHFRSISRRQQTFLRRQSAPPRLEQVIVQVPAGVDAESISNCSILPRYEVDKAPPAYTDSPSAFNVNDDMIRPSSVDLSDVPVADHIGSRQDATLE
ncbi:hypothetical protein K450DRAFT_216948 [Umbelopsis ramanniana AG]|uniref:Uncharacterized protein n=1 Tax=Umbelopsis ramanniana AG TaxID=1314678 RepID=A0AAD5HJQ3_UMBRA|nr:uncharacterized protein K450DRAFT_216948 [Umbelopsis ramanniana AG]KAI8584568.1 hypothetical protein K450DRAFT_216948 [Umbelopsis ramanniana AG]